MEDPASNAHLLAGTDEDSHREAHSWTIRDARVHRGAGVTFFLVAELPSLPSSNTSAAESHSSRALIETFLLRSNRLVIFVHLPYSTVPKTWAAHPSFLDAEASDEEPCNYGNAKSGDDANKAQRALVISASSCAISAVIPSEIMALSR